MPTPNTLEGYKVYGESFEAIDLPCTLQDEGIFEKILQVLDPTKPIVIWIGISAPDLETQCKFEQKIQELKTKPLSPEAKHSDLTRLIYQLEHKQWGEHLRAFLVSIRVFHQKLKSKGLNLQEVTFCDTSFLHRFNRHWIESLKNLDLEAAGEKAVELFGRPWMIAHQAMIKEILVDVLVKFDDWKTWSQDKPDLAKKHIQQVEDSYKKDPAFRAIVENAVNKRIQRITHTKQILTINREQEAHDEAVCYIEQESAKIRCLVEEHPNDNILFMYPGRMPPSPKYLLEKESLLKEPLSSNSVQKDAPIAFVPYSCPKPPSKKVLEKQAQKAKEPPFKMLNEKLDIISAQISQIQKTLTGGHPMFRDADSHILGPKTLNADNHKAQLASVSKPTAAKSQSSTSLEVQSSIQAVIPSPASPDTKPATPERAKTKTTIFSRDSSDPDSKRKHCTFLRKFFSLSSRHKNSKESSTTLLSNSTPSSPDNANL
jgi:hypothetical protein